MSHPRVVNVRAPGARWDVYIGRGNDPRTGKPGRHGNPYTVREHGREGCMRLFLARLERQDLGALRAELAGKVLGCWCAPELCHGEPLARLADGEELDAIRTDLMAAIAAEPTFHWRALTITQPWAWLIAAGVKTVENRTWLPYPAGWAGPLMIHAGKGDEHPLGELEFMPAECAGLVASPRLTVGQLVERARARGELQLGQVVAVAERVEARAWTSDEGDPFAFGPVCWWLHDVRRLRVAIPARGLQKLWTPGPALVAQVEAAIPLQAR